MNQERNRVIFTQEDYNLLKTYVNRLPDNQSDMSLAYELNRGVVVTKDEFPPDTIRLNSTVSVLDIDKQKTLEYKIVVPEKADIRQGKISILAPLGTALIGFRKGQEVKWSMPAGTKNFRILDVINT